MSPRLKPLLLPQLVEERRKLETQQLSADDEPSYLFYTHNSSSSDIASPSPVTPTFSRGHSRYSGSTSSLELMPSSCSDSPASPTAQLPHQAKSTKSQLPDVQEDPMEREDEDRTILPDHPTFHDCLCTPYLHPLPGAAANPMRTGGGDACLQDDSEMAQSAIDAYISSDFDYDLGFLSDGDLDGSPRQKKRRGGYESPFAGWSTRLGSRFPNIPRWRSSLKRSNISFMPASEPSLDHPPSLSRAASSRSSSMSAPSRRGAGPVERAPAARHPRSLPLREHGERPAPRAAGHREGER